MLVVYKSMPRLYCDQCRYPRNTCLCQFVEPIELPVRVIVIQHGKEASHAKNTIRLAKLVSPQIEVVNTDEEDVVNNLLAMLIQDNSLLVYPSESSSPIEEINLHNQLFDTIIILDGSWRQAYSIWQSFPKMRKLQQVHFKNPPTQKYRIRKSKKQSQLSSIEALAYSVDVLTKIDTSAYLQIFEHMQERWDSMVQTK